MDRSARTEFKLYQYEPSIAAAATLAGLFGVVAILHGYKLARHHPWFMIPLFVGSVFEVAGFAGRTISATQQPNFGLGPYIIQSVFPLVAPALFAASIYMVLGRVIAIADGEVHSIIKKKWLTKIFVIGDILAFTVQAGGSGLMSAGSLQSMQTGSHVVVAGLLVQTASFAVFAAVAVIFHTRILKDPKAQFRSCETSSLQKHMFALYASSLLIMVRSVFRVVEFAQGNSGYLFSHEWFLYVFDALLMLVLLVILYVVYPGQLAVLLRKRKDLEGDASDKVNKG